MSRHHRTTAHRRLGPSQSFDRRALNLVHCWRDCGLIQSLSKLTYLFPYEYGAHPVAYNVSLRVETLLKSRGYRCEGQRIGFQPRRIRLCPELFSPHRFARTSSPSSRPLICSRPTQNRLATGKKVNSALDNPTNFFTAASLDNRASDISNLLDGISNGTPGAAGRQHRHHLAAEAASTPRSRSPTRRCRPVSAIRPKPTSRPTAPAGAGALALPEPRLT